MNSDEFRKAAHSAVDEIIDYYDSIQNRRALSNVEPGYLRKLLPSEPPEEGEQWADIQRDIEAKIMPGLTHWYLPLVRLARAYPNGNGMLMGERRQSPNFMAYYPANVSYPSILGELYSAAFTAPAFNWLCSPAVTELETVVLDWLAKLLHLPECFLSSSTGGGVIQGSASESVVTVMVAARERRLTEVCGGLKGKERDEKTNQTRARLVALASDQSHSSVEKAALIVGVRFQAITAKSTNDFALTGEDISNAIAQCAHEGLEPFFLSTTLGTTATCAIDRFQEIKESIAQAHLSSQMWIHVDAAYAGSALICDEYAHSVKDFGSFDSFDVNMHKWLLTNFDASCLFVRNRTDLTSALSITPSYLRTPQIGLVTDYRDWQIPLGRRFRSIKIWFIMRTYGIRGMQAHIRRHIALGEKFAQWMQERKDLYTIVAPPRFALTVVTVSSRFTGDPGLTNGDHTDAKVADGLAKPDLLPSIDNASRDRTNTLTKEIYERINAEGDIFLTSCVVEGIYAIRVISANEKTDERYLRKAFDILVRTAEDITEENRRKPQQTA